MERIPTDLQKVLAKDAKAKTTWQGLTPIARRDFVTWIESAKQAETRKRRVDSVPSRLASGKRRPCCFVIVPMSLYTELGKNKKAQATWKKLTPDERRDFTDWVTKAKDATTQQKRIKKASALLAAGKLHV